MSSPPLHPELVAAMEEAHTAVQLVHELTYKHHAPYGLKVRIHRCVSILATALGREQRKNGGSA